MNRQSVWGLLLLVMVFSRGDIAIGQTRQLAAPGDDDFMRSAAGDPRLGTDDPDAQRAEIWNSPRMLRARAWVQEYLERSTKYSPQESQEYMRELERLTPIQMRLWLLKFDDEQEELDRRQQAFDASRQAAIARARGINESTRDAYGRVVQGAQLEAQRATQSQIIEERAANRRQRQKRDNRAEAATQSLYDTPYPSYGNPYYYLYGPVY